ncbi:hypothetical protein JCM4914_76060 [Streptomyces platensis subsp. malvinus]
MPQGSVKDRCPSSDDACAAMDGVPLAWVQVRLSWRVRLPDALGRPAGEPGRPGRQPRGTWVLLGNETEAATFILEAPGQSVFVRGA